MANTKCLYCNRVRELCADCMCGDKREKLWKGHRHDNRKKRLKDDDK